MAIYKLPKEFTPGFSTIEKPTIPVEIDWSNPLSEGLVRCWVFNTDDGAVYDLKTGERVALPTGHSLTPDGLTMVAHDTYVVSVETLNLLSVDEWAIVASINDSVTGDNPQFYYHEEGSIGGDNLLFNRLGGVSYPRIATQVNWTTVSATGTVSVRGTGKHSVLGQKRAGNLEIYTDGGDYQSAAQTATDNSDKGAAIGNSYSSTTNNDYIGDIEYLFIFKNRSFSAEQVQSLHSNPYQILKPAIETVFFTAGAGGGATINLLSDALTLAESTLTIQADIDNNISLIADGLTITEATLTIQTTSDVDVALIADTITLTESTLTVQADVDVNIALTADAITLTENALTISLGQNIALTSDAITLTENTLTIQADVDTNVSLTSDILTLTEATLTISAIQPIDIALTSETITLTENLLTIQSTTVNTDTWTVQATNSDAWSVVGNSTDSWTEIPPNRASMQ